LKSIRLASLALIAAATLGVQQAAALSEDDKTMNTASGAPRFSDPDDQTPSVLNLQGAKGESGGVDPSSIRYDYDASSGSYVPHKQ
jgi:hypothetical protein